MPRRLTSLLAAGVTALGLALTAAPAQAVTYVHDDAVGDVLGLDLRSDGVGASAAERRSDITQLRVRHGRYRVVMRVEVDRLTRRNSPLVGPVFRVRTPRRSYVADLSAISLGRSTTRSFVLYSGNREVRCRGAFADFDFSGNVAMVSVPRRCIGSPRRVQVGAGMVQVVGRTVDTILVDDAQRDGQVRNVVALSPPIRSGPRSAR